MDIEERLSNLRKLCYEMRPFKQKKSEDVVYSTRECKQCNRDFVGLSDTNELGVISSAVPDSMRFEYVLKKH